MSHPALPESSALDAPFVVGTDLVEFDRRDLPIYQTPEHALEQRWADACVDDAAYGAPLDRLFGEPEPIFIDGVADAGQLLSPLGPDALVVLGDLTDLLADSLALPAADEAAGASHDIAAIYDFGADSHAVVHLHDSMGWEQSAAEWSYDHHG
ncbi:MAG: hypothetical protein BGN99_07940 [Alphaproteobacteria bacterium 65-37]|nr:MAG: hypothetical protein BGN99_07940 [Alphaproteobacteria bacterium 65-37]